MWVVTDEKGKTVKVCYKETEAKKYAYTDVCFWILYFLEVYGLPSLDKFFKG